MKLMIDTNILLDVLCAREKFLKRSLSVWRLCEDESVTGCISAVSVPNIIYILRKEIDPEKITLIVERLSNIFEITDLRESDLKAAAAMHSRDFEDAVHMCQAKRIGADYIITRNVKDFKDSPVPAVSPEEFLDIMQ